MPPKEEKGVENDSILVINSGSSSIKYKLMNPETGMFTMMWKKKWSAQFATIWKEWRL